MTFPFRLTVAALLSSLLLFALSCGERPAANAPAEVKTPDATVGVRGGGITYRVTGAPTTFNYLLAEDEPTIIVTQFLLTSRLVEFDHDAQKFVAGLAETWTTEADGKNGKCKTSQRSEIF